jgi:hypothetical protein
LARSTKTEHRARFKARIVLMAADGAATRAIARALGCTIGTASKWRVRYAKDRIAGFTEVGDRGAEAGLSGILCAGPVAPSGLNEPFVEHDSELGLSFAPFARRHFPCLRDLAQDEIQQFDCRLIGGKMPSCAHGAAQFCVERLDGVGNRCERAGAEDPAASDELAAYGATIRDRGAGSAKGWAGRFTR